MKKYLIYVSVVIMIVAFTNLWIAPKTAEAAYTWTTRTMAGQHYWTSLASSADGTKIAATELLDGYIYTSADSGATWLRRIGVQQWSSITSSADGMRLAAASNGYIFTSSDAGNTWTSQSSAGNRNWSSVASSADGSKIIAAHLSGYIYSSSDGGLSWVQQINSGIRDWMSVASSANGTKIVAATANGLLYTSADGGTNWAQSFNAGYRSFRMVTISADGKKIAATTMSGFIYTSIDGGVTWIQRDNAGSRSWGGIAFSSDGTKLVAGEFGGNLFYSIDNGNSWKEEVVPPGGQQWVSIAASADGNKLALSTLMGYIYTATQADVPIITLISPNGGETLQKGGLHEIKWTSNIATSSSVTIYVKRCPSCAEEVGRVPNIGSYMWTVDPVSPWPPTGQPGYRIAIYGGDNRGSADDVSDGYFNISTTSKIVSRLNPSSPIPSTVVISPTVVTDNVVLGVFDFKSQDKNATLRSIKFKVWTSTSTIQIAFNTIKIKVGSTIYYPSSIAQSGAYAVVTYTNLAIPMPSSQFVPITVYGVVAPDRTGVMNGARVAVNILASNSTVYADDVGLAQVPVAQTDLTSSDLTLATTMVKSITLDKTVLASSYRVGDMIPIKWTSTGVTNVVINLLNYKGTSVVRLIGTSTASVGQYNWKVPANIDFDYDTIYTIAVADAANPNLISKSGKIEFTPAPTPPVISPLITNLTTSLLPLPDSDGATRSASVSFGFTLNATSTPLYISTTASSAMTVVPVGTSFNILAVSASPVLLVGDTGAAYIIPAGSSRRFKYAGMIDNSKGSPGQKVVRVVSIMYGTSSSNFASHQISSGLEALQVSTYFDGMGSVNPPTTPPVTPPTPPTTTQPPVVTPVPVTPTILPWTGPSSIRTGETLNYTLNWSGGPFATSPWNGEEWKIFLQLRQKNTTNIPVSTGFYSDPLPSKWGASKQTPGSVLIPAGTPAGEYDVLVGMFVGSYNYLMTPGAGVTNVGSSQYPIYKVGTITVGAPTSMIGDNMFAALFEAIGRWLTR